MQGVLLGRLGVQAAPRAAQVDFVGEHHTLEAQVDSVGEHHILEAIHVPRRFANLNIERNYFIKFYFTKMIHRM